MNSGTAYKIGVKPVVTCESRLREPVSISSALQSQNAVSPYL